VGNEAVSNSGDSRPQAEGFPVAPLIEAVIAVQFDQELTESELEDARSAILPYYPTFTSSPHHELRVDAEGSLEIARQQTNYAGEALDPTEVVTLRAIQLATSQLAPYRDWTSLYSRFSRDFASVLGAIGERPLKRIAVRSVNRIDVPPVGSIVRYEDYITIYPKLPPQLDPISDFRMQVLRELPEIGADAKIIVGGYPSAIEGKASFVVDIDLFRTGAIPPRGEELDALFNAFRAAKNELYQLCLTPEALKEFS
jgi:uncharacterized protein (TIGR04255 family)